MNADQIADELGQPGAQHLLETATLARVAYNGGDGTPRVIPIGFYWNGDSVVVCTATGSPKVRALQRDPRVAVTIDTGDTPADAKSVLVRGVARLETVDGVPDEFLRASTKSLAPADVAGFEEQARAAYAQMVRISIAPAWARFYDFGAGRLPGFMQQS
jgi:nitroimidazol reductase NimA-like FMN-containing flavoprotein (pyridoxamine 5'-phosphate oxidase superfamily)